ncbi:MAG: radical SAM protein, partial [Planctomycetaceae bacterium]|nr:radical SAM protein [Planctomycetaceae bacterium]
MLLRDKIIPLYYKYTTSNGNGYVYDVLTGQIVWLSEEVYLLLEDYFVLEKQAFHDKCIAGGFTEEQVRSIIKSYRRLQSLGILNIPQKNGQNLYPYKIFYEGGIFGCDDFFQYNARLLILEITQQCNLRCEYCCYGNSYSSFRNHSRKIMDIEVAKRAIDEFLHRDSQERHAISFYGGEPLLAFGLLQSIIDYSNQLADDLGKQRPSFNLTTNGTLLNDSIIHYFVKNDIAVLISLDGARESHDRCRKYNTIGNDH